MRWTLSRKLAGRAFFTIPCRALTAALHRRFGAAKARLARLVKLLEICIVLRIELVTGTVVPVAEASPERLRNDVAALRGDCL